MKKITFLFIFISTLCFGQVGVNGSGFCSFEECQDPRKCESIALQRAKEDAFINAGVKTEINTSSVLVNKNTRKGKKVKTTEEYSKHTTLNTFASLNITKKSVEPNKDGIKIDIVGDIIENTGDSFLKIEGLQVEYREDEPFVFDVTAYERGFLYIFYFSGYEGELLYPLFQSEGYMLENEITNFVLPRRAKYLYEPTSPSIFIVLINDRYAWKGGKVTEETVLSWYHSLPQEYRNTYIVYNLVENNSKDYYTYKNTRPNGKTLWEKYRVEYARDRYRTTQDDYSNGIRTHPVI